MDANSNHTTQHPSDESQNHDFKPGDLVFWHYTPRGGWGYTQRVYATVVKVNAKTITIQVQQTKPVQRCVEKRVSRANVYPRTDAAQTGGAS